MTARARLALATMALALLVVAAYLPVKDGVFVWDDHALVAANRALAKKPLADVLFEPFWTADPMSDARPAYYRPVVTLSYRFDLALADDDPSSFHLTNLGLHLLAMAALVALARRLGASTPAAIIAGGAWALVPRLTESVAWVSGRTDVLAAVLGFASMALWPYYGTRGPAQPGDADAREVRDFRRAAGAAVLLLLALLAKEVALACALAMIVGTLFESRGRPAATSAKRIAWVAGAVAVYGGLRAVAMSHVDTRSTPLGAATRVATVLEAAGRYLVMTLVPWSSASSIGLVGEIDKAYAAVGALTLLLLGVLVARLVARARTGASSPARASVAVAAVLGVAALAPVLHLVPLGLAAAVAADRLLYIPLAALALALALAARSLPARAQHFVAFAGAALALSFVPATSARARDYSDEIVFRVVAAETAHPLNTSARSGLANVLLQVREHALACRIHGTTRAILERTGRAGTPRHTRALENVAGCLIAVGDYDGASAIYDELAARFPNGGRVRMEIGFLALHRFELDRAEASFRRALELEPALAPARRGLADLPRIRAQLARVQTPEARAAAPAAWALVLTRVGRRPDAITAWTKVLDDDRSGRSGEASEAVTFLQTEADLPLARRALDVWEARGADDLDIRRRMLALREAQHARVEELRPRIEALAAP